MSNKILTDGERAVVLAYTPVDEERLEAVQMAKKKAAIYFDEIVDLERRFGKHRDFSLAKTKLQEASMWLTRGLTNPAAQGEQ